MSPAVATLVDAPGAAADPVLRRAVEMRAARSSAELTVYDGDLTGVAVPRLDRPVSPTELETWIACPHKYFMRYLLGVYEVEEPGDEISITALDKGSALHVALDCFNQAVLAGDLPQPDVASAGPISHVTALAEIFDTVRRRHRARRAHRSSRVLGRRTRTDASRPAELDPARPRVGA